jgi:hypothetical protein
VLNDIPVAPADTLAAHTILNALPTAIIDLDAWDTTLQVCLSRVLDDGADAARVFDHLAGTIASTHIPTGAFATRAAELMLSHLETPPDAPALLGFVNDTLISTYPPEPQNKVASMWLIRTATRISSTTLLLVLSLSLAVLAIMLSLPNQSSAGQSGEPAPQGVWNVLTPKRSQALIARKSNIAVREAEVARREAEILAGAPSGIIGSSPMPTSCPPCVAQATFEPPPVQTVIKEVVQEKDLAAPGWKESNVPRAVR